MRLEWDPRARNDLIRLREYISEASQHRADLVAERILDAVESLVDFPHRGRLQPTDGTRRLVVARTPYIVAYIVEDDVVYILRVLHGARRWPDP